MKSNFWVLEGVSDGECAGEYQSITDVAGDEAGNEESEGMELCFELVAKTFSLGGLSLVSGFVSTFPPMTTFVFGPFVLLSSFETSESFSSAEDISEKTSLFTLADSELEEEECPSWL